MPENSSLDTLMEFGFVGILGVSLLEKLVPIIPSYVMLVLLGFTMPSSVDAFALILATTISGSLAGSVFWYFIGRTIGEHRVKFLVVNYGKYFFLKAETYDRIVSLYRSNYVPVAMVGQVIPTVRVFTALPAGVLKLPFLSFTIATFVGILIWNLTFLSAGFILRDTGMGAAQAALVTIAGLAVFEGLAALCLLLGKKCLMT